MIRIAIRLRRKMNMFIFSQSRKASKALQGSVRHGNTSDVHVDRGGSVSLWDDNDDKRTQTLDKVAKKLGHINTADVCERSYCWRVSTN